MSLDREELKKLGIRFPLIKERKLPKDNGFSSRDYVEDNLKAAEWLLDNSEMLLEVLIKYRRITEITSEGEKPNE
jgi:hypothetical protein